jgi:E3 ubiquitin-protein ligase MARCH6
VVYFIPYAQGRALIAIIGARTVPVVRSALALVSLVAQIVNDQGIQWLRLLNMTAFENGQYAALISSGLPTVGEQWEPPKDSMNFRVVGTLTGYVIVIILAAMYVKTAAIRNAGHAANNNLLGLSGIDQAEKILKIIIIIGIELVVFPIYCGTLLHVSLLPLLENTSLKDFISVTAAHPTVITVLHWAFGTFYMFVFAMFVTMCRKIMRPGVLYFVRDPSDPEFHPIKDALERPLLSQLKKIAISGLIYSALILVCIGQVISALRYRFNVSYFPLKLAPQLSLEQQSAILPLISVYMIGHHFLSVRDIKRMAILRRYWKWVFVYSCKALRLSSFIMNDPTSQEQGSVRYGSPLALFQRAKPDYTKPLTEDQFAKLKKDPSKAYFVKDGCFVRAPSSDSIQSSADMSLKMFVTVTKDDERLDGLQDPNPLQRELRDYTVVYVPPHFRRRVALLLGSIWLFGIIAVLCATALPLVVGKGITSLLLPQAVAKLGDIFHFYVGAVPLLLVLKNTGHFARAARYIFARASEIRGGGTHFSAVPRDSPASASYSEIRVSPKQMLLFLALVAQCAVISCCLTLLLKCYVEFPLQKAFDLSARRNFDWKNMLPSGAAILHMLKIGFVDRHPDSAIARDFRAIFRHGLLQYDYRLSMKKIFLPAYITIFYCLFAPISACWLTLQLASHLRQGPVISRENSDVLYTLGYPLFIVLVLLMSLFSLGKKQLSKWIARARDEVYLVGERLHNVNPT